MTITLKNASYKILQVLERLKEYEKDLEIEKVPNDETLEAMRECEEILSDIQAGKRAPYSSWQDAKEALLED